MKYLLALLLAAPCLAQQTYYVNANLTSGANDGSSWANAFQGARGLKDATNVATNGDTILVAQGTYRPAIGSNRDVSIRLKAGVKIYGNCTGNEADHLDRPPIGEAPTILDGDLAGDDGSGLYGDNSYNCLNVNDADFLSAFDGFIVRGGNADGPTFDTQNGGALFGSDALARIRNCHFLENQAVGNGGAVFGVNSRLVFDDCTFEANVAGLRGGAAAVLTGDVAVFDRCTFKDNEAPGGGGLFSAAASGQHTRLNCSVFLGNEATGIDGGGAILSFDSDFFLRHSTLYDNRALASAAGAVAASGQEIEVVNCILWENEGAGGAMGSANQVDGSATVEYSLVQGGFPGTGNVDVDPQFVDAAGRDLRLAPGSPCIDAATNYAAHTAKHDRAQAPRQADDPSTVDTGDDFDGSPVIDMGAYEFSIGTSPQSCVPFSNSTGEESILTAQGSLAIADNDVNFHVRDLPTGQFGYFLMSETTTVLQVASGNLCLGGPQIRFNQHVLNSSLQGSVNFSPNLTSLPQGISFQPGETWHFQLWHRDGPTSNFSSALTLTWE